jgi:hypothetical protein
MSPSAVRALRALLFTASFASGAVLLRAREAHCCSPPVCPELGERLLLRPTASRVDGVAQPLPSLDAARFEVANDRLREDAVSARLYDPASPGVPRVLVLRRLP